ncbi:hypothetical protein RhiJN_27506 [Ceratobasidium sp. AG-Ba]|nr:hypothetical protein RhiJN_13443 [Ceratobasidium sp. AG-Ba]QRV99487.1 hypothetical protein RhiJN_27506 [Ceratobasidium sp. AG-Ba]
MSHAADILAKHYTSEDHVIVVHNSPTHHKQGAGAPSAARMPKYTPKEKNLLAESTDDNGNKVLVPMTGGYFSNGEPQLLYWPANDKCARWFKGMAEIAKESRDVVPETVCQKNTEFLLRLRQNSGMPEQETEQESVWGASFRPGIRLIWHPAGIRQFLRLAAAKQISKPTATQI